MDLYQEAIDLYGLIHARYILTPKGKYFSACELFGLPFPRNWKSLGLAMMREKYTAGHFGTCPRVLCNGQMVLPIGMSEYLKYSRVKVIFCPLKRKDLLSKMWRRLHPKKEMLRCRWRVFRMFIPSHILAGYFPAFFSLGQLEPRPALCGSHPRSLGGVWWICNHRIFDIPHQNPKKT